MKKYFLLLIFISFYISSWSRDSLSVCSPSGQICVKIWMSRSLHYRIYNKEKPILEPSEIDMLLANNNSFSLNNAIKSYTVKKESRKIISPVPEKRKNIHDEYNLMSIEFTQPYKIEFRVYDDGVAYRFLLHFKDSVIVQNELAEFHFPGNPSAYFPAIHKRPDADIFHTSFEESYPLREVDKIEITEMAYTPVLVVQQSNPKIAITESDLEDYPGMFISGTGSTVLKGVFAPYPLEEKMTGGDYPQSVVTKRAGYIAKTKGTRTFPWRVLIIADEDKQLPSTDIV